MNVARVVVQNISRTHELLHVKKQNPVTHHVVRTMRPLSEKIEPGESVECAALRGIREELSPTANVLIDFVQQTPRHEVINETPYRIYDVFARVDLLVTPNNKLFMTRETKWLHYWAWVPII